MVGFLGKLHLLILHLPIGILLLAALLEWVRKWKETMVSRSVLSLIYFIGTLSTLAACVTGFILSRSGDYTVEKVSLHQWAGILTLGLSTGVLILSLRNYQKIYWSVIPLSFFVGITGHLGGNLTHGEGFLWNRENSEEQSLEIIESDNPVIYADIIQPILDYRCVSCHNNKKSKGKLKLHSKDHLEVAGKSGKSLLPVNTDKGMIFERINLPLNNEDHMPPEHKSQLTGEELQLINWWIEKGASFESRILDYSDGKDMLGKVIQLASVVNQDERQNIPSYLPSDVIPNMDKNIINRLQEKNVVVLPAGSESPFLEINFVNVDSIDDELHKTLEKLVLHTVRLKMSNIPVEEKTLSVISNMKNLVRLYLDETNLTDDHLKYLSDLPELRYLNLNGNNITAEGLQQIKNNGNLQEVFVYNSVVERDFSIGQIKIISGHYTLPQLETDTIRIPQ